MNTAIRAFAPGPDGLPFGAWERAAQTDQGRPTSV